MSRPLGRAAPLTLLACAFAVLLSMPVLGVVENMTHVVCPNCGYYQGRTLVETDEE